MSKKKKKIIKKSHQKVTNSVDSHQDKSDKIVESSQQLVSIDKQLIVLNQSKQTTETVFSKKLEEVISENELVTKRSFFSRRIILLGPPAGYTKEEWKAYLQNAFKSFLKYLSVLFLVGLVASAVVVIELISDDRVLPRVAFAGQDFGYLKLDQAKSKLDQQLQNFANSSITFHYGEQTAEISLSELGIQYDLEQSFNQLPQFNFPNNNFINLIGAEIKSQEINPIFKFNDQNKLNQIIEKKLGLDKLRAHNAQFYLDDKKKLQIKTEQDGIAIDQSSFNELLTAILNNHLTHDLTIPTVQELPQVKAADLQNFQSDLEVKLDNEMTLNYNQKSWKFKPKNHLEFITYNKNNDQVVIKIEQQLIDDFFQKEVFDQIERPVSDLKISQEKDGKINFDGQAKNGLAVNHQQFIQELELGLNSLDPKIDIPTSELKANVEISSELQELGIKELVSTGHTAFAGSPQNRRHNVAVGMAKFNGLMIKPGETFSFNDNLGPVDGSTGYRLELVIKAEGTVPEFGGGLCQVSSTVFKAGLFAGLPIVERAPHSYAVGYYAQIDGYGLDSTIYPGVRDLRFTNDTGYNILIQTFVDGDDAYVNFFGTSDGRQVHLENYWRGNYRGAGGTQLIPTTTLPTGVKKQIESAHGGFDASWERVIAKNGQETREKIYSVYRATANRILVGQ